MRGTESPKRSRRIGAHVSSAGGPTNALTNIKNIGGNCLQIFAGSPRSWARKLWDKKETDEFVTLATAADLYPLFIHALYLVNLGSDNKELIDKSTSSLIFDLENGLSCQSSGVIIHLGSAQERGFASVKEGLVKNINYILDQTESTPFVIENSSGQKGKIGSLEEIRDLFAEIKNDRLKLCLDSAHLFEAGFDLRGASVVEALVNKLDDYGLLEHLVVLHLNDSKTDLNSRHDQHANLGEGKIGLEGLANFANHSRLSHLPIILEVPGIENKGPGVEDILAAKSLGK